MNQQINLYQPMFRKQKVLFSAMTMLQVGVFFLILFASLYAYQSMQLKPYQKQLASLSTELIQLQGQVAVIESRQANKSKSKLLENYTQKVTEFFSDYDPLKETEQDLKKLIISFCLRFLRRLHLLLRLSCLRFRL